MKLNGFMFSIEAWMINSWLNNRLDSTPNSAGQPKALSLRKGKNNDHVGESFDES